MRGARSILRSAIGAAFLLAAMLALAVRLLVPPGFMPDRTADGWTITVCTGHGVAELIIDRDGKPVKSTPSEANVCPFALLASPLSPAVLWGFAFAAAYFLTSGINIRPLTVIGALVRWRPPAHAPPVFVR